MTASVVLVVAVAAAVAVETEETRVDIDFEMPAGTYMSFPICFELGYFLSELPFQLHVTFCVYSGESQMSQKRVRQRNLTKLPPQFLLNFSGYKHDERIGYDSF